MEYTNRFLSEACMGKDHAVKLRDSAFLAILESAGDMMFIKDVHGVYAAASMPFVKMVGKERLDQVVGRTDFDIFEDQDLAELYVSDDKKLKEGGKDLLDYIEPLPDEDGHVRYGSTSKHLLYDEEGTMIGLLGITRDITRDHLTRLYYQNEIVGHFDLSTDVYAVALVDLEDWRLVEQRFQSIDGIVMPKHYTVDSLIEEAANSIVEGEGDGEAAVFYQNFNHAFLKDLYDGGTSRLSFEYLRRMPDGTTRWVQLNVKFLIDPDTGRHCVMLTIRDIDIEKQEEIDLETSARMDKMTMLLNRETVMEEINWSLKEEPDKCHTLLMLDVDNFKNLNDTRGHQVGDEFLISLAKALRGFFRENDIIGRVGGDEFFVLMKNTASLAFVEDRIQSLLAVTRAVCAEYPGIGLSVSIGVSQYPEDGQTLERLYAEADKALYKAKKSGKDRFWFA